MPTYGTRCMSCMYTQLKQNKTNLHNTNCYNPVLDKQNSLEAEKTDSKICAFLNKFDTAEII